MTPSYIINVSIINVLWTIANGRRLHNFQQEFQSVYECIEKITGFMSRAAIMSFLPFLARVLPEGITRMERGRYFRDRFVAISEVFIHYLVTDWVLKTRVLEDPWRNGFLGKLNIDILCQIFCSTI